MPTYGSISDPKAKPDNIKGVEPEKEKSATGVAASKKSSSGSAGGMFASSGSSKKKEKAAAEKKEKAQKIEEEKDEMKGIATVDMSMPSYSDNMTVKKKSAFAF